MSSSPTYSPALPVAPLTGAAAMPTPIAGAPPIRVNGAAHLVLFTALSLTCYLDRFIMGALVTPVKTDLGLSDEQVGRIEAAFNIAYVIGVPLFGFLGDRIPRKGLLLIGLVLWSVASIGSGFATSLIVLLGWRALVGFGEGSFNTLAPTWLADVFSSRVRNLVFSVFNSASKVGATVGVIVGGYMAAQYSWHAAFWFAGVPGLVLAIGLALTREPVRGGLENAPAVRVKPTWRDSLQVLRRPEFLLHTIGYAGYMIAISTMFLWGPAYLHREFGLTNASATSFFGMGYTTAGLPGAFLGGLIGTALYRRTRAGYAWTLSAAMILVAPVLVAALTRTELTDFRVLIWTEMVLFGICSAPVTSLVFEVVPVAQRGVALATALVLASGIGGLFPTTVVGLLSDHWGLRNALFVSPAAALIAATAWAILALRQSRRPVSFSSVP